MKEQSEQAHVVSRLYGARSLLEICQASFQKSSFRFLSRESQRPFVRCARLRQPSQPPAQIRSRRMCKVEVHQITAREDGVY
jgi:hypothetical protein